MKTRCVLTIILSNFSRLCVLQTLFEALVLSLFYLHLDAIYFIISKIYLTLEEDVIDNNIL